MLLANVNFFVNHMSRSYYLKVGNWWNILIVLETIEEQKKDQVMQS